MKIGTRSFWIPALCLLVVNSWGLTPGARSLSRPEVRMAHAARQQAAASEAETGPQGGLTLKSGTEIPLKFAQNLSSKHATIDERVELVVAADVTVGGTVVVPAGTRVLGTVVQGKKNEKYGNAKELAVKVDYIVLDGRKIPLTGEQRQKGKTNVGSAAIATVGFGLSGLMIYMSQREAWIREGTAVTAYVAEDVELLPSE